MDQDIVCLVTFEVSKQCFWGWFATLAQTDNFTDGYYMTNTKMHYLGLLKIAFGNCLFQGKNNVLVDQY